MCKLRINAMPTLSRTSRGRVRDRSCRCGCGPIETSNHVIQACHRTHGMRIKRHDAICKFVSKGLTSKGYLVEKKPIFDTAEGKRRPDLIATIDGTSIILDAQIRSEQSDLRAVHRDKVRYYGRNSTLIEAVKRRYGSEEVISVAVTLNWRGMWGRESVDELLGRNLIKKGDLKIFSSRVLVGGIAAFNMFSRSTSVCKGRKKR